MFRFADNPFGLGICAALAFFLGASNASTRAEDQSDNTTGHTMLVSTRGIDLASAAGQRRIARAIDRTARQICDGISDQLTDPWAYHEECHDNAGPGAMAQLQVMIARVIGPRPARR